MKTSGIYIHIPFCVAKCIYCDFYSVAGHDDRIDEFVESLILEINRKDIDNSNWKFDTIFIGGGTPSLLSANHLEKIVNALQSKYGLSNVIEFTLEANPGEAPIDKLKEFKKLGVNRLSIGVQSFKPHLLHFLSRIHTARDAIITFENARQAGFDNINCDLIYNIINQSLDDWKEDLNKLIELNPEHISAYSLTVENGTKLYDLVHAKTIKMPSDQQHLDYNSTAFEILNKNGFIQYEISNYSKLKKECLHNLHYWENDKYLGFGPSAHSFDGNKRWNNFSNLEKYISLIKSDNSPIEKIDQLTEIEKVNEIVGFGLRMTKGIDLSIIPKDKIDDFNSLLFNTKSKYPDMIIEKKNRIKLNQKGFQFADAIAVDLML